jgi:hypothetical protein
VSYATPHAINDNDDGNDDDCDNNSIQFFIYLRAELNSRGPITESARNMKTNNNTTTKQNKTHIKKTRQKKKHERTNKKENK